jgi:hypothetical protein
MKTLAVKGTHYGYIRQRQRTPNFRSLAAFPHDIPDINLPNSDSAWLVRLLEGKFMVLLDTLSPGAVHSLNIKDGLHRSLRIDYGLQSMNLHRLNHAFSVLQCIRDGGSQICGNCKRPRRYPTNRGWIFDRRASEIATVYLCQACNTYQKRHNGAPRPAKLYTCITTNCSAPMEFPDRRCKDCHDQWVAPNWQNVCVSCGLKKTDGQRRCLQEVSREMGQAP